MGNHQEEVAFLKAQLFKHYRGKMIFWGLALAVVALLLNWGAHHYGTPSPTWLSVLLSQLASVLWGIVASMLMIWGVHRYYTQEFGGRLAELERKEMCQNLLDVMNNNLDLGKSGITKIHSKLDTEMLTKMLSQAREKIWIVENWMCMSNDQIQRFISSACSSHTPKISIALLHPYSPNITRRSADVNGVGGNHFPVEADVIAQLKLIAQVFGELRPEAQASCKLLCHECVPSIQVYLTESCALIGFYLQETRSAEGIQIVAQAGGTLYEAVHKHVKYILESRVNGHAITEIKARGPQEGANSQLANELHGLVGRQIHGLLHRLRNLKFHTEIAGEKIELKSLKNNEEISNEERIKQAFRDDSEARESLRSLAKIVASRNRG